MSIYPAPTVVFNAPGCGHMPNIMRSHSSLIHNIDSQYGFINKIGENLGEIRYIDVPDHEADAKSVFEAFDHKLYAKSQQAYQQADQVKSDQSWADLTEKGLVDLLHSSDKPWDALERAVSAHHGYDDCEAQTSKFDKRWCELKTSGNYLTTIIMAQHAMLNMLNTLKETQYHALAYRYI